MGVGYTNRKGDVYYLYEGNTRTGKRQYCFSRSPSGTPAEAIPAGYEIYESPEAGLVFLRKLRPVAIIPFEREMVANT